MQSDKIKVVVSRAKALTRGEDDVTEIKEVIVQEMGKARTFAVAIIQRLKDDGVDLMEGDSEMDQRFRDLFKSQIENLGERELTQMKRISNKLFG
jgi:hypothetical protein